MNKSSLQHHKGLICKELVEPCLQRSVLAVFRSCGDKLQVLTCWTEKSANVLTSREQNIVVFHKGIELLLKPLLPVLFTVN